MDMAEGLGGHNIIRDNFFTSYKLGQELLQRKLTMVGAMRKNRSERPNINHIYWLDCFQMG